MVFRAIRSTLMRAALFGCSALVGTAAAIGGAQAQTAGAQPTTLGEVVVTAQKRVQRLQDVPVSVSAISTQTLQANRIASVMDLNAVVPNVNVKLTAGGTAIPSFTIRGVTSYGVVPGSDKEVSIYVDGVYLGASRGSSFDLPDLAQIEILRGPQGTLFGRNSTAGAVSIITRDPPGHFGAHQEFTYGNYNQFRSKTRIDLPAWGPLSATFSYLHDQRDGDIKNLGAGQTFDATATGHGILVSPKTLGGKDANVFFLALKFQPVSNFSAIYKFDYTSDHYTPEGVSNVGVFTPGLGAAFGPVIAAQLANQITPPMINSTGLRPSAVNNGWTSPSYTKVYGHNLTMQWRVNGNLSLKNILAYRYTYNYSNYQFDGLGGLVNNFAFLGPVGSPYELVALAGQTTAKQLSDEQQINYNSKWVTVTAGLLYFHEDAVTGGPPNEPTTISLSTIANNVVPVGTAENYNKVTSEAAYAQAEVHATSQIDIVAGYRETQDHKTGRVVSSGPIPTDESFVYNKTGPAYTVGVNYKPMRNLLLYVKYSSSFVSGGQVGSVPFKPETAKSWEGGIKGDFLDRRLRADLSVFDVTYKDLQSAQAGYNLLPPHPELSTVIADLGGGHASGFEFEGSALLMRGLTLDLGVGHTSFHYTSVNPIIGTLSNYLPTLRPDWTMNVTGQYETEPLFDDARMLFRIDANWRDKERVNPNFPAPAIYNSIEFSPANWTLNARIALTHLRLEYGNAELAIWAHNLNDSRVINFADTTPFLASTNFKSARTFGIDFTYDY